MTEQEKTLFGCVGAFAALPLIFAVTWICEGFVAKQLWAWYIAPTFGLPLLNIPQALGLAFLWSLLSPTPYRPEEQDTSLGKVVGKALLMPLFKSGFTLLAAWIVYHWM